MPSHGFGGPDPLPGQTGEDLIETWLDYKRTAELDELRLRPHPHEFELYYDV